MMYYNDMYKFAALDACLHESSDLVLNLLVTEAYKCSLVQFRY